MTGRGAVRGGHGNVFNQVKTIECRGGGAGLRWRHQSGTVIGEEMGPSGSWDANEGFAGVGLND